MATLGWGIAAAGFWVAVGFVFLGGAFPTAAAKCFSLVIRLVRGAPAAAAWLEARAAALKSHAASLK